MTTQPLVQSTPNYQTLVERVIHPIKLDDTCACPYWNCPYQHFGPYAINLVTDEEPNESHLAYLWDEYMKQHFPNRWLEIPHPKNLTVPVQPPPPLMDITPRQRSFYSVVQF